MLVNYLQNEAKAEETAALVRERGAGAVVVQGNVRSEADLKRLAAALPSISTQRARPSKRNSQIRWASPSKPLHSVLSML